MANPSPLRDRRILVVEDEYFLAMELERDLRAAGARVIGPAPSVGQALALIASEPDIDVAVLDVNLRGEVVYPAADALIARRIPFLFATGYGDGELDDRFPRVVRCVKPFEFRALERALLWLLQV
jgi:CheY-like chemotaxis protein